MDSHGRVLSHHSSFTTISTPASRAQERAELAAQKASSSTSGGMSLLLKEERDGSHDYDKSAARQMLTTVNDEDYDDPSQYYEEGKNWEDDPRAGGKKPKGGKRMSVEEQEVRERQKAINESRKVLSRLEKCTRCPSSSSESRASAYHHLIVAVGVKMYLALPAVRRLCEGHCMIIPINHTEAQRDLDEDEYEEVQYWKKTLAKMYSKTKRKPLFIETVQRGGGEGANEMAAMSNRLGFYSSSTLTGGGKSDWAGHTAIECIPLPEHLFEDAQLHFVKALQEADEEWSTNRKLIDLTQRGLMKTLPSSKSFSYFAVEFGVEPAKRPIVTSKMDALSTVRSRHLSSGGGGRAGNGGGSVDEFEDDEDLDPMAAPAGTVSHEVMEQIRKARAEAKEAASSSGGGDSRVTPQDIPSDFSTPYPPGLAQIIEDRSQFPSHLGHEVVCGLLGDEPFQIVLRQKRQPRDEEVERVRKFKQNFREFDWTTRLKANQSSQPRF